MIFFSMRLFLMGTSVQTPSRSLRTTRDSFMRTVWFCFSILRYVSNTVRNLIKILKTVIVTNFQKVQYERENTVGTHRTVKLNEFLRRIVFF